MQKTRKWINILNIAFACVALMLSMSSCSGEKISNGLMANASPDTSALELYCYDGENIYSSYSYDRDMTQSILDELDSVKAKEAENWSLDDIALPIYGFWIGSTDGSPIFAAWSNGYWITKDGKAYSFDYDFEKLEKEYPWTDKREASSFAIFPCAYYLSKDENGWRDTLLSPADELKAPQGITMTLEAWKRDAVAVNIANNRTTQWMYGEFFDLQVLLDGIWYEIPTVPENWAFLAIGINIKGGEEQRKMYNISMYGQLPAGTYRLAAYGLSVEHTIE